MINPDSFSDKINLESLIGFTYKSYESKIIPTIRVLEDKCFDGVYDYKLEIICKPTWGHTIGHTLRRILLECMPGIKTIGYLLDGAKHPFSAVKGIKELTIDIGLRLNDLFFIPKEPIEKGKVYIIEVTKSTGGYVYFKDFANETFSVLNGDEILCSLDYGAEFHMKLLVTEGVGFRQTYEHEITNLSSKYFLVDTQCSFISKCSFEVREETSLQEKYDTVILSFSSKKPVEPTQIVEHALVLVINEFKSLISNTIDSTVESPEIEEHSKWGSIRIEDCASLTQRAISSLTSAGINTVQELLNKTQEEVRSLRGIGEQSIKSIEEFLQQRDLTLKKNNGLY